MRLLKLGGLRLKLGFAFGCGQAQQVHRQVKKSAEVICLKAILRDCLFGAGCLLKAALKRAGR